MRVPVPSHSPPLANLSKADRDALHDLYLRGTPDNTLRAYERDLLYITSWKRAAFDQDLSWPEQHATALRFVLDHNRDLTSAPAEDHARRAAQVLIDLALRKHLSCPAPATLDRRIASWRAFHRMRNLDSPFDSALIRQARTKGRRANARPPAPKSANPITRPVLEDMLATCQGSVRDCRDRAILMLGWASGGRRRSEIVALRYEDLIQKEVATRGLIRFRMIETKTTARNKTPGLVLKGRAAQALLHWLETAGIDGGPLFRPISKSDRVLPRPLSPDAIYGIVRHRLILSGYAPDFASPHGLRSGFLTQAALDGAPIQAAMRLSLHRSLGQAQRYYDDVDIAENPTADLLG